jgi:sec-independent protein translocase protein TatC
MFVVGAVLTPPDVVSQIMLAIPMIVLYEIGVAVSFLVARRRRAASTMAVSE